MVLAAEEEHCMGNISGVGMASLHPPSRTYKQTNYKCIISTGIGKEWNGIGKEWNGNIYISQTFLSQPSSRPYLTQPHSRLEPHPITSHHMTHLLISTQAAPSDPPNPSPHLARGTPPHSLPISRRNQTFSEKGGREDTCEQFMPASRHM